MERFNRGERRGGDRDRGSRGGGFGGRGGGFRGGGGFRSGGFGRRPSFGGPREMHKATCSACKKECEVPFKPSQDRPVYCKECYMKMKDGADTGFHRKAKEEVSKDSEEFEESEEETKEMPESSEEESEEDSEEEFEEEDSEE